MDLSDDDSDESDFDPSKANGGSDPLDSDTGSEGDNEGIDGGGRGGDEVEEGGEEGMDEVKGSSTDSIAAATNPLDDDDDEDFDPSREKSKRPREDASDRSDEDDAADTHKSGGDGDLEFAEETNSSDLPKIKKKKKIKEGDSSDRKKKKKMRKEKKKKAKKERKEKKDKLSKHRERLASLEEQSAEESSDAGSSDDDSKGSEDEDDYMIDDFVVGDDEVEELEGEEGAAAAGSDSDSDDGLFGMERSTKPKKKKKNLSRLVRNEGEILDDDELDLIASNNRAEEIFASAQTARAITQMPKPRRVDDVDMDEEEDAMDEVGGESGSFRKRSGLYDDDDLDDFIVDEYADQAEAEEEKERRLERRAQEKRTGPGWPSEDQLRDAMAVFGADFDLDDEEFDDDAMPEEADEHGRERASKMKKFIANYERIKLIESFSTERDDELKRVDRPERFQIDGTDRGAMNEDERMTEAEWIAEKLKTRALQGGDDGMMEFMMVDSEEDQEALKESIIYVLRFIQVDQYECPFIWTYRRDYLHRKITRGNLWYIYMCDEKWEALIRRKIATVNEIDAVVEGAAEGADELSSPSAGENEEALDARVRAAEEAYDRLQMNASELNLEYSSAKEKYESAYEKMQELEESEAEVTDDARAELEVLQQQFESKQHEIDAARAEREEAQMNVDRAHESLDAYRKRNLQGCRYKAAAAREILRQFPHEQYKEQVSSIYEEVEIEDVAAYLSLLLIGAEKEGKQQNLEYAGSRRRLRKSAARDAYTKAKQVEGLREIINSFSISAAEFGEAQRLGIKTKEPPTPEFSDVQTAQSLVDGVVFKTPEGVLAAMRTVVATEIAHEPSVKKAAREVYRQQVKVSTFPTSSGVETITPFHEMFGFHLIEDKPISTFMYGKSRSLFAKLVKMEKEGLIKISFNFPTTVDPSGNKAYDTSVFMSDLRYVELYMPTLAPDLDMNPLVRSTWDKQRLAVLSELITKQLIPTLEEETRRELLRSAREAIVDEARENFEKMVQVGPFRSRDLEMKKILKKLPHRQNDYSVAVIYILTDPGKDKEAISMCLAYLNREGVVKNYEAIPSSIKNQARGKVKQFLKVHKPEIVAVNASGGRQSRTMLEQINRFLLREITDEINQEMRDKREERKRNQIENNLRYESDDEDDDDFQETEFQPAVFLVADDIARIFKYSRRCKKMFPDLPVEVASSICLGRYVQEPLAELCAMWGSADPMGNFGFELLFLDIHPMKLEVGGLKSLLLRSLEQVLVDAVCDVGVNWSQVIAHDHLAPMLAFVSGLGLRKADSLRQIIRRDARSVTMRKDLLEKKLLGKVVFNNAAGFLLLASYYDIDEGDLLDCTRIHPECYGLPHDFTRKICSEALEVENDPLNHNQIIVATQQDSKKAMKKRFSDDPEWISIWEKGMRPTECAPRIHIDDATGKEVSDTGELEDELSGLDLEGFAAQCEGAGKGKRYLQFNQIKEELRFPFMDMRKPLTEPTAEEMFGILTGENDYTLHVGMPITCQVLRIQEYRAELMLDNSLRGFVKKEMISDEEYNDISQVLNKGMTCSGVVLAVHKSKMLVEVSMRESDLKKPEGWWVANRHDDENCRNWWNGSKRASFDQHFVESKAFELINKKSNSDKKAASQKVTFKRRIVYHPSFQNCTYAEAETTLREAGGGAGEVIIRPSTKSPDHLSITWAFQENWFKHIEVEERDKRPGDQGLGKTLVVQSRDNDEVFSDLDEIIANYIGPMNDYVTQMLSYKSFKPLDIEEAKPLLLQRSVEEPSRVPYFVCFDKKYAGYFALIWYIKESASKPYKTEYISVRANGYRLRDQTFSKPNRLIEWFKMSMAKANAAAASGKGPGGSGAGAGGSSSSAAPAQQPRKRVSRFAPAGAGAVRA